MGAWLTSSTLSATVYVLADVARSADLFSLKSVTLAISGDLRHATGDDECSALLRDVVKKSPDRWFAPRALDLLAAMVDRGLPLPAVVVDPQHVVHAVDAANSRGIDEVVPQLCLGASFSTWCSDLKREAPTPSSLESYAGVLTELDDELRREAAAHGVSVLVDDVAATLPVLARAERRGAWVGIPHGYPSWTAVATDIEKQLDAHEARASFLSRSGLDMYLASYDALAHALTRSGSCVPDSHLPEGLSAKQYFERLVAQGDPIAVSVDEARTLSAKTGPRYWLNLLTRAPTPVRLRGMSVPQASGRWGLRACPLQNVPKHSALGRTLRSGLIAPPGTTLVAADQSGYEVRLLADLSNDKNLLSMTRGTDVHAAIGQHLFGSTRTPAERRQLAKTGTFAVIYGQSRSGFIRRHADLSTADAGALYDEIVKAFPDVFKYRTNELSLYAKDGQLRTRGGRIIRPAKDTRSENMRAAFNGLIQGLAADIQRWVLRELDVKLRPFDAYVVHQAHDEVFVAVPSSSDVAAVATLLVTTMTDAVMHRSGLLRNGVTLHATGRRGMRWLDLI